MMERHSLMARLPIELGHMIDEFESYILQRDPSIIERYEQGFERVKELLKAEHFYAITPPGTPAYSTYRRSLLGMMEYYDNSARTIMSLEKFDDATFQEMSYLKTQAVYIVVRAQELVVAYLDASNEAHESFLLKWQRTQGLLFAVLAILLLLDIGTVLFFIRDLSSHLYSVENAARELSLKNWLIPDLKETRYSELKSVGDAFNDMKKNIIGFIEDIEHNAQLDSLLNKEKLAASEREKTLRETQLRALQLQINPHFLFNTLNMVGRSAMFMDSDVTVSLVESISSILRYSLDNEGKEVFFSKELSVLKAYILIQEVRHGDRIRFLLDIDEAGQDVSVPPMILQPLVENSITHGLKNVTEDGLIQVSTVMQEGFLNIEVRDNGCGISEESLENLWSRRGDESRKGIGVTNVRDRLELSFSERAGFTISNAQEGGTIVSLTIPCKERLA
ncbi:sensor histidine kinase [Oceanispirochaeta sp.]|jgi:two-component system sensor histidine kinase YesM|uniref:sensor histidine kinase n=1 Tax=Oceanispirochaeta sp. TaxID=2035350 RepID=UPI002620E2D2|nr:sensor histidine kinase [Oceanispirochaeta sp.]MDA3957534.1 sensor histidine kinase [Oceanispirochaeta sp.]